ncbi:DUF2897 family protein [Ningiella sp. W23]|uniref:DUF2897 family protein n=1 Tax=Ningiella sp. W23 TaxID=3023715 RepID=UPI003757C8F1
MSTTWIIVIIVVVLGLIVGNILLLRDSSKFKTPKNFKKRPDSDYDGDDKDDW